MIKAIVVPLPSIVERDYAVVCPRRQADKATHEYCVYTALTQVLKVLLRVEVSTCSAFGVLKVELSSGSALR